MRTKSNEAKEMINHVGAPVLSIATITQVAVKMFTDLAPCPRLCSMEKLTITVNTIIDAVWFDNGHYRTNFFRVMKAFGIQWPAMMHHSW
jgi:hypothetical protein